MKDYRAYLIDRDGHITGVRLVAAEDDRGALETARQYVDGHDIEVWDLSRKVGKLTRDT